LIITRNKECKLSKNRKEKQELFTDITYSHDEIIDYCNNLIKNPPKIKKIKDEDFKLRDYQLEAIEIINKNKNVIISLPTGCGKNVVIIYSINEKKRYLILVPRIILMEQIKTEIIKHRPDLKNKIQTIGDNNNEYDETKNITICVYNSVLVVEKYSESFDKIFIDEAHHINIPEIYEVEQIEDDNESIEENDNIINDDEFNTSDEEYYSEDEKETILKDDTEDEIKNTTGYNKIIKSFGKYNNNVYLSATIDEIKDFTYYKKDIRDMIDNKYLCDYTIHIPIFSDDPSNKNICEHLLRNYRNIIIYCNSQKEGKKINELLNILQKGCSEYIDCKTSRTKRDKIIKSYKEGEIPFLVNVRILVEGFDAPITKGVCFIHLPSSKTIIIQIIGRALRLHPLKTYANIILPFSSKDDETSINKFLKILAQNDKRIKKSYESKTEGGYISIEKIKDEEDDTENKDIEFRYDMIYDSMGILQNGEEIWMKRLEDVKKYIDENGKKPSSYDINKNIKSHGRWIKTQQKNYKYNQFNMKNIKIKNIWIKFMNDYKKYIKDNIELWFDNLKQVIEYININFNLPSSYKDENYIIYKIGNWVKRQKIYYKNNNGTMKNNEIKKAWKDFINNYKIYFISDEQHWNNKLNELTNFVKKNNKIPSKHDNNNDIRSLCYWMEHQKYNFNNNKGLMKNIEIKNSWEQFYEKNKEYFISDYDEWIYNLEETKKYINLNKKKPLLSENKQLAKWIYTQTENYNNNKKNMKIDEIKKLWEIFQIEYKQYFLSYYENWLINFNKLIEYIKNNLKRPSQIDKNEDTKKLGSWLSKQLIAYKNNNMKISDIRTKWKEFITDPKYSIYF
jgi:superfamily II DNA/RNA helicase